jgi:arylsulfatase A-like enzyme
VKRVVEARDHPRGVAKCRMPPDLEGIDLLPLITGPQRIAERTVFFRISSAGRNQRAIRQGDWKLLLDGDDTLLFNVRQDPGERNDLARQNPEIARMLRPLITAWEKDVDSEAKSREASN